MSEIVWEDPPDRHLGAAGRNVSELVAELKNHPGKWALVREDTLGKSSSAATYLKRRYGCETRTRTSDGTTKLYARWPE